MFYLHCIQKKILRAGDAAANQHQGITVYGVQNGGPLVAVNRSLTGGPRDTL